MKGEYQEIRKIICATIFTDKDKYKSRYKDIAIQYKQLFGQNLEDDVKEYQSNCISLMSELFRNNKIYK